MQGAKLVRVLLNAQQIVRYSSNNGKYFVSQLPHKHVRSPFADKNKLAAADKKYGQEVLLTSTPAESQTAEELNEAEKKIEAVASPPITEASTKKPLNKEFPQTLDNDLVEETLSHQRASRHEDIVPENLNTGLAKGSTSNLTQSSIIKPPTSEVMTSGEDGGSSVDPDESYRQELAEQRRKRLERNTRLGGKVLLGIAVAGSVVYALYNGRAKRDDAGNVIPDGYGGSMLAPFYRIYDSIWEWRDYVVEPARDVLLPDPLPPPYLQPKYTVVIEMKNVLVSPQWSYKTGHRFAKRPALDYFLDVVGYPNFEVVIYTSESLMVGPSIVDAIDPKGRILYKLFRDCTKYSKGHHLKDLSKLNRDLSKVIYIDYDAKSGRLNPENMLRVPEWKGNSDDTDLVDLAELLKTIHLSDVDDVRPTLQYYSQFDNPAQEFRRRATYVAEQEAEQAPTANESFARKFSGKLFGFRRHQSL